MELDLVFKIALLIVLTMGSAFFSGSEAALFTLGFYRVRRLKIHHPQSYKAAQKLLREPTKLISTILTGNELVNTCIGVLSSLIIYRFFGEIVEAELLPFLVVAITLPILVIFGEIIPKTLGMKNPELVVAWVAVPLEWFSNMVAPIRNSLASFSNLVLKIVGKAGKPGQVSEEMFRAMVDTGREEGVLDSREQKLIHNVFRLDDVRIGQIMTPKAQVSFLRANMTVEEVMKKFETDRYSRFPVLAPQDENVIGVLYVKDLLGEESYRPTDEIFRFVRPHLVVLTKTNALELFIQFRMRKTHFAVVIDEFSGVMIGVVTLENVLEQIFGAIRDEHDVEEVTKSTS